MQYTVKKGKETYMLRDEIQLSAFLNSGWKLVENEKKQIKKSS